MQTVISNNGSGNDDGPVTGRQLAVLPSVPMPAFVPSQRSAAASTDGLPENFESILFESAKTQKVEKNNTPPDFFHDLNLDQIVEVITAGREEYDLKPFFYTRLTNLTSVNYRLEIMRDLDGTPLFENIKTFSNHMRTMRLHLAAAESWLYKYAKERWWLAAVETYCNAIKELRHNLNGNNPQSRGFKTLANFLDQYIQSEWFQNLSQSVDSVNASLAKVRYCVRIKGGSITVSSFNSKIDYTALVEETFAKFKQGAVKSYLVKATGLPGMNHVGAGILDRVALLYPDTFQKLDDFCMKSQGFRDIKILTFDREIQFYIAYLEYSERFKQAGLKFCYPQLSDESKEVISDGNFDLALAGKLLKNDLPVVCNDFFLKGGERIFVVTGPNQGGKTTFARTFGQLHYLANLGCPVPGSKASLFLFDQLFTHFEREEDIKTLRGKLQDDLLRIHKILEAASPRSIVIINEIFSSTSVGDGVQLAAC